MIELEKNHYFVISHEITDGGCSHQWKVTLLEAFKLMD